MLFCEEEDETFDHIFHNCQVFWAQRREAGTLNQTKKAGNQSKSQMTQIRCREGKREAGELNKAMKTH